MGVGCMDGMVGMDEEWVIRVGAQNMTFFEMGARYRGVGLGMERAYYTLPLPNYVRISLANVLCSKAFIR